MLVHNGLSGALRELPDFAPFVLRQDVLAFRVDVGLVGVVYIVAQVHCPGPTLIVRLAGRSLGGGEILA